MTPISYHPLLAALLQDWHETLGDDFTAYHNHCYRVLNYFSAFHPEATTEDLDKVAVALAYHDLGIWTHHTLDYLDPSAELARIWLAEHGHEDWSHDVAVMIAQHHKVRSYRPNALADAFRKADWTDFTQGARRFGLAYADVRQVQKGFPNAGFHARLAQLGVRRMLTDPLHPLPMFRL